MNLLAAFLLVLAPLELRVTAVFCIYPLDTSSSTFFSILRGNGKEEGKVG